MRFSIMPVLVLAEESDRDLGNVTCRFCSVQ